MSTFNKVVLWCKSKQENGVYNAFPVDKDKDQSSAQSWASDSKKYNLDKKDYDYEGALSFEYPNDGFDNVYINNLDYRGNGGRAYKVVIEHDNKKFLVDFREDGIMDVIKNTGIEAGGKLNGKFVFIKEGAQTKLVRIGSSMYDTFKKLSERKVLATMSQKSLIPFHMYRDRNNYMYLYLGEVYIPKISESTSQSYKGGYYGKPHLSMENKCQMSRLFIRHYMNNIEESGRTNAFTEVLNQKMDFESEKGERYPFDNYEITSTAKLVTDIGEYKCNKGLDYFIKDMQTYGLHRWNENVEKFPKEYSDSYASFYGTSSLVYPSETNLKKLLHEICCSSSKTACLDLLNGYKEDYNKMRGDVAKDSEKL